jgi:hypothetical protein
MRRTLVTWATGVVVSLEAATLVCVPAGLGPDVWIATCAGFGLIWALAGERIVDQAVVAWKQLGRTPTLPAREGDGATLLALFAMAGTATRLFDVVLVLSPEPDPPSWLHPVRRWQVMRAWVWRNAELVAETGRLAERGLLRCVERGRWLADMGVYEITGLGRDVAARNAEVLAGAALATDNINSEGA